jgi:tetratricopeptide (TPR) repeat protein
MPKTQDQRTYGADRRSGPCGLALAIGLVLVLPAAASGQPQAVNEKDWAGKQVVQRRSDFALRIESRVIDRKHQLEIFRVEKGEGPWLWLKAGGLEGWAPAVEVVPADEALEFFTNAVRANPNNAFAFTMRGVIWLRLRNDPDVALGDLNEAIRLDPTSVEARLCRGEVRFRQGDLDKAVADFTEASRLDPASATPYALRAVVWRVKKDYDKAIEDCSQAIRLDPTDPRTFNLRGIVWDQKKHRYKAIADYSEAIRLDPKGSVPYFNRGFARLLKRDYDRAIADFTETIRLDPKNGDAYEYRGHAWSQRGQYDRSIADFTEAIRLDPRDAFARNGRALAWAAKREFDKAVADYNEAIRLAPRNADYYVNRGRASLYRKEYDQSIADLTTALSLEPRGISAYLDRSIARFLKGREQDAIVDCRAYLARADWKSAEAIRASLIGHIAARRAGKDAQAWKFLDDIQAKGDATAWPFPVVRFFLGALDEKALFQAATSNDRAADVRCFLGLDLALKGRHDDALSHYRWIVEQGWPGSFAHRLATGELDRMKQKVKANRKTGTELRVDSRGTTRNSHA